MKELVHRVFLGLVFPWYCMYSLVGLVVSRESLFWTASQTLSLLPGKSGSYLRKAFYSYSMSRCDAECAIMFGTIFSQRDTEIGRGVYIGPQCNIGMCRIEDNCTVGSGVHILSGNRQHRFDDPGRPVQQQGGEFRKVVIGENSWIGNGAIVMANVGRNCVVGAGAVVTRDVEEGSVVAGNPARLLRKRA